MSTGGVWSDGDNGGVWLCSKAVIVVCGAAAVDSAGAPVEHWKSLRTLVPDKFLELVRWRDGSLSQGTSATTRETDAAGS